MTIETFFLCCLRNGVWLHRYPGRKGGEMYCMTFGKRRFLLLMQRKGIENAWVVCEVKEFPPRGAPGNVYVSMAEFLYSIVVPFHKNKS